VPSWIDLPDLSGASGGHGGTARRRNRGRNTRDTRSIGRGFYPGLLRLQEVSLTPAMDIYVIVIKANHATGAR